jgi:uncharacterized membrane protein
MNYAQVAYPPVFSTPLRWALRVLAWLAFGVSAYLAWNAVNQTSVAGCGFGDYKPCDIVLGSSWSKWFGVPVAVLGLACYATLAGLSVLLELRNARLGRWINTAFVMLSVLAAAASLWFIGLQIFAIGHYCIFCLVADICGIALGAIAVWSAALWLHETRYIRKPRVAAAGLMALRSAMPTAGRGSPTTSSSQPAMPTPSLPFALSGALAALAVLVGVQLVFPAKTHTLQEGTLDAPIALVGTNGAKSNQGDPTSDTQPHVAMRIPSDGEDDVAEGAAPPRSSTSSESTTPNEEEDSEADRTANGNAQAAAEPPPPNGSNGTSPFAAEPERLVKFLGGKLTLDVYKHPLIGSPKAPHVMVEMVSYDCPHCRKMHGIMKKGLARYGDQLAIIVMPIPFEKGCNKLLTTDAGSHPGACVTARLAIGIGEVRPSQFVKFHDWLMSGDEEKPPILEKALPKAYELAGRDRLRTYIRGEDVNKQIAEYVDLYSKLRGAPGTRSDFGLPVQILGDKVMSGSVEKEEDVFKAWEEHLGLEPR